MLRLPWMSRTDRRRWQNARTATDLGDLMARWLEGRIGSRPGYTPRYGPDDETAPLVPALAALCRAGYITTCSQPGLAAQGADGGWWEQRAAVEGVVTDPRLLHRLVAAATAAGMLVRTVDYSRDIPGEAPIPITTCDGETTAAAGRRITAADMAVEWPGLNPELYEEITHGTYVHVVHPEFGPTGERLWDALTSCTQAIL